MATYQNTKDGDRAASVLFRMSEEDRNQLKADASRAGITVQALLERRVFGRHDATSRHGGRVPRAAQREVLPLKTA